LLTGPNGHAPHAIETGIGADGPACILHMGIGSGALGGRKAERAAYIMPDWVGRMASITYLFYEYYILLFMFRGHSIISYYYYTPCSEKKEPIVF